MSHSPDFFIEIRKKAKLAQLIREESIDKQLILSDENRQFGWGLFEGDDVLHRYTSIFKKLGFSGLEQVFQDFDEPVIVDIAGPGDIFNHLKKAQIPIRRSFALTLGNTANGFETKHLNEHSTIYGILPFRGQRKKFWEVIGEEELTHTFLFPFGGYSTMAMKPFDKTMAIGFEFLQEIWQRTSKMGYIFGQVEGFKCIEYFRQWKPILAEHDIRFHFEKLKHQDYSRKFEAHSTVFYLQKGEFSASELPVIPKSELDQTRETN